MGAAGPPRGMIVIATLLVVLSVQLLFSLGGIREGLLALRADPILSLLTLATAGAGLLAARTLWTDSRGALTIYLVTFGHFMARVFIAEARVEPVMWKWLLGSVLQSLVPVWGAIYLIRRTRA